MNRTSKRSWSYAAWVLVLIGAPPACSSNSNAGNPDAGGSAGSGGSGGTAGTGGATNIAKSGDRLRARYLTTADGLKLWRGISDTELDTTCAPRLLGDGSYYCVPPVGGFGLADDGWYLDENCTKPAVPDYLAEFLGNERFVALGDVSQPDDVLELLPASSPAVLYEKTDGACLAGGESNYLELTPAGDKLARFEVEATDTAGPMFATFSDGSRFFLHFEDPGHATPCFPAVLDLGAEGRCLPIARAEVPDTQLFGGETRDETCSIAVALDVRVGSEFALAPTDGTWRVFAIGEAKQQQPTFASSDGSCLSGLCDITTTFALGAEIPVAEWPLVTLSKTGGSRITYAAGTMGGVTTPTRIPDADLCGAHLVHGESFFDGAAACSFEQLADGSYRCMPELSSEVYSDAGCTQPVALSNTELSPGTWVTVGDQVHATQSELSPPVSFYKHSGSSCAPASSNAAHVYALSSPLPPETFAEGTFVVE